MQHYFKIDHSNWLIQVTRLGTANRGALFQHTVALIDLKFVMTSTPGLSTPTRYVTIDELESQMKKSASLSSTNSRLKCRRRHDFELYLTTSKCFSLSTFSYQLL